MASNSSSLEDLLKLYYLPVTYSLIFVGGLLGNITSICIYVCRLRPWKSGSIIMVNLSVTDLLYVLTLPFLVRYYINDDSWEFGDVMCRLVRFGFHFHLYASILFLTCLAAFRHLLVARPLDAAQLQRARWGVAACACVWILSAAQVAPMLTYISTDYLNSSCLDFASTVRVRDLQGYGWGLTVIGFMLPLVAVFVCHIGIVRQLAIGPAPSGPHRARARKITVLILVVFATCFLPYHALRLTWIEICSNATCSGSTVHAAYIISRPLAGVNIFFNLALYTLSGEKFRRAFKEVFYREHWVHKARLVFRRVTCTVVSGHPMETHAPGAAGDGPA